MIYVQDNEGPPPPRQPPEYWLSGQRIQKKGHLGVGEFEDKFVEICNR